MVDGEGCSLPRGVMPDPFDLLTAGRFAEAAQAYRLMQADGSKRLAAASGLAHALCGLGDYRAAIPVLEEVHQHDVLAPPGSPGQRLELACAHWCLDERSTALDLAHGLCADLRKGKVYMAPDLAGGATFGLVLHYMAVTARVPEEIDYALACLKTLNAKYDKQPRRYDFPVQTVKQLLGQGTFEQAWKATRPRPDIVVLTQGPEPDRPVRIRESIALFHDGVQRRTRGDEAGCLSRMRQVFEMGHRTDLIRWRLARHEVAASG